MELLAGMAAAVSRARRGIRRLAPREEAPDPRDVVTRVKIATPAGCHIRFWCLGPKAASRAKRTLTKEPTTIRWLDKLTSSDTLWDIGANIGSYSLYAAVAKGCQVIAIEPGAANFFTLCRNIEDNNLGMRITPYCIAIARETRVNTLYMPKTHAGSALSSFGTLEGFEGEVMTVSFEQGTAGYSIDDLAAELGGVPSHIKIDVDGIEHKIIEGGMQTLSDERVKSVIVEIDIARTDRAAAIETDLLRCGLKWTNKGEAPREGSVVVNAIFSRHDSVT